jgi:hypothetical protein
MLFCAYGACVLSGRAKLLGQTGQQHATPRERIAA